MQGKLPFQRLRQDVGGTPEERKLAAERAAKAKKRRQWLQQTFDVRNLDLFGYEPDYTFQGYRSNFGAYISVAVGFAVLLRFTTRILDFMYPTPLINENHLLFARDMSEGFALPTFGFIFKRSGWRPFYDPTYFTFSFQQGTSGRASNSTYVDLGDEPCSFVDAYGRIIEDEARCPAISGEVVGSFFDSRFRFVHVSMNRCHNGTDSQGRTQPGPCRRPDEIDRLIYEGTVTLAISQRDLDTGSKDEYTQLVSIKKQFTRHIHATYDMFFTVRFVTIQPRAFFDEYDVVNMKRQYVVLDRQEASFTDFQAERLGRWNQVDPTYVPKYAGFFFMLSDEKIDQQRRYLTIFDLFEALGGTLCFFYFVLRLVALRWNHVHFTQQIKGLDLRDLNRDMFDQFGRLVDRSFQVPRELQDMHNVANLK